MWVSEVEQRDGTKDGTKDGPKWVAAEGSNLSSWKV